MAGPGTPFVSPRDGADADRKTGLADQMLDVKKIIKHYIHTRGGNTLHLCPTAFLASHDHLGRVVILSWSVADADAPSPADLVFDDGAVRDCAHCANVEKIERWHGIPVELRRVLLHLCELQPAYHGMSAKEICAELCRTLM